MGTFSNLLAAIPDEPPNFVQFVTTGARWGAIVTASIQAVGTVIFALTRLTVVLIGLFDGIDEVIALLEALLVLAGFVAGCLWGVIAWLIALSIWRIRQSLI